MSFSLRIIIVLFAAAALVDVRSATAAAPDPKAAARLDPEQARQISRLLTQFRAARKDSDKRAAVIDEAIGQGPVVAAALHAAVGREMQPLLKSYSAKFYQQATGLAKKKVTSVDAEEVLRLRATVLGLQDRADFSKEVIQQHGDPALKRLEEIFVVDRQEVLDGSESLQADRAALAEMGALWEKCALYLFDQLPDDENKPKERPSLETYLAGEEALACGLAAPMDAMTREILAMNARLASQLQPEEARAVLALNLTRNLLGLSAVLIDLKLCETARDHSADMQKLKFFAHESPVEGKKTPWDRAKRFGTTASGENIAMGYHDGKAVNMGWFHSPGHHKNMLGKGHKRVGMGQAGAYFTELFGG
jgi:uncharacterized protein YkwD